MVRESSTILVITGEKRSLVVRAKQTKLVGKSKCNGCRYRECQKQKYAPKKKNLPKTPNSGGHMECDSVECPIDKCVVFILKACSSGNKQVLHESVYPIITWFRSESAKWLKV